jgi:hypothetical protein
VKRLFYNKSQLNSAERQKATQHEKQEQAEKRKQEEEEKTYVAIVEQQKR